MADSEYVRELKAHHESFWHEARNRLAESLLDMSNGKKVLEIGVGSGSLAIELAKKGCDVWAADISSELLETAEENAKKEGVEIRFVLLDLSKETIPERFDHIIMLDVLEHIEDDQLAAENLKKMLNEDGDLILTVPSIPSLYGEMDRRWGHYRRYTKKSLKEVLSGFKIKKMRNWNFAMVLPAYVTQRLLPGGSFMEQRGLLYENVLKRPWLNRLIERYYVGVENRIEFPLGMSLLCRADLT